jgi:hypothetical protein
MIASGSADYSDTEEHLNVLEGDAINEDVDIGLIIGGVFLTLLGICLMGKNMEKDHFTSILMDVCYFFCEKDSTLKSPIGVEVVFVLVAYRKSKGCRHDS